MGVGAGVEAVEEGEHLGGVPAGAEDYEKMGGVTATASEGWLRVEGGKGVEEAELLKREGGMDQHVPGGAAGAEMGARKGMVGNSGQGAYEEGGEEDAEGGPDESYAENVDFVRHACEALIRPQEA